MKNVYIFVTDGNEICETLMVIDILKRANINIQSVSISKNKYITSSCGIEFKADTTINEINISDCDMIVLPGGMPGTLNLANCEKLREYLLDFYDKGKLIAAICAAPSVLGQLGILKNKKAICYPGFEEKLIGANISTADPCVDKNIITASGLGHCIEFSLEIVKFLLGNNASESIKKSILFNN